MSSAESPPRARPRGPAAARTLLLLAALVATGGCGREAPPGRAPAASGAAGDAAPADRPDTSRAGPAFLAVYRSGPLDELRVVRATDGGIVVAGACGFPEGTRVTIALLSGDPAGAGDAVSTARAVVERGRFMSAPLAGVAGPPAPGLHVLRVSVPFGPGDQDPAVLAASADGRRFRGPGVRTLADGRIVFETLLEVPL